MKSNRIAIITAVTVILLMSLGCMAGMVKTTQPIPSILVAKQYNDVASNYFDRPTFVSVEKMHDGSKVLSITMAAYGVRDHTIKFFERDAPKYIEAVDKFLIWEAKALENRDMIDKEIAVIPAPNLFNISFYFTSGNQSNHFLSVGFADYGLFGKTTIPLMIFDHKNANILRKLFVDLPNMSTQVKGDDYK
jgi:hypothetical protein